MAEEKRTPKVSIIIPVYNAEKAVRRCVDSVLDQEYTDFELLLMDDGSKDGSPAILDEYAEKDERVRVVHKENSGVSATRNMALDMARGDWVQFLDADDWITKDATKLLRTTRTWSSRTFTAWWGRTPPEKATSGRPGSSPAKSTAAL